MNWIFVGTPEHVGWYPVIICYEIEEGVVQSADYWNGDKWNSISVLAFGDKCTNENDAIELAYKNDIE